MKRSKRESVLLNGERSLSHRVSPVLATKSPTLGKMSLPPHPGLLPLSLAASPLFSRTKTHDSLLTEKQSHLMKRVTPCETRALLSFPSPLPWRREQGTSGKAGAGVRLKCSPLSSCVSGEVIYPLLPQPKQRQKRCDDNAWESYEADMRSCVEVLTKDPGHRGNRGLFRAWPEFLALCLDLPRLLS